MAREMKSFISLLIILVLLLSFKSEARPFNILKSGSHHHQGIESKGFFVGLYLGAIKQSGPSPGQGNKFTDAQTFGAVKDGPSPGQGNKFTDAQTFGVAKDGPSPGQGH